MTKPNGWTAAWLILGCFAFGMEVAALITNGAQDSLSAQVWWFVGLSPWIAYPALAIFGAGGAWMAVHFFGRRS